MAPPPSDPDVESPQAQSATTAASQSFRIRPSGRGKYQSRQAPSNRVIFAGRAPTDRLDRVLVLAGARARVGGGRVRARLRGVVGVRRVGGARARLLRRLLQPGR